MLCRITHFSNARRTGSVSVMGQELSKEVIPTRLVLEQRKSFDRISLFWSVVLPGHASQQNGGDHGWLIQTPMSTVQQVMLQQPNADSCTPGHTLCIWYAAEWAANVVDLECQWWCGRTSACAVSFGLRHWARSVEAGHWPRWHGEGHCYISLRDSNERTYYGGGSTFRKWLIRTVFICLAGQASCMGCKGQGAVNQHTDASCFSQDVDGDTHKCNCLDLKLRQLVPYTKPNNYGMSWFNFSHWSISPMWPAFVLYCPLPKDVRGNTAEYHQRMTLWVHFESMSSGNCDDEEEDRTKHAFL